MTTMAGNKKSKKKTARSSQFESTQSDNLFFLTFIGEKVEILCSFEMLEKQFPQLVQGYLLDKDDEYLYLGSGPDEIHSVVRREDVKYLQIIKDIDPMTEVLDNMPKPEKEEDVN